MGLVRKTSVGLGRHGHPEFVLRYDDAQCLEADVENLMEYLETTVAEGVTYEAGETFQMGWMLCRIEAAEGGRLTLHEPDFLNAPPHYVEQVTMTLQHLRLHTATAESVGLLDDAEFPGVFQSVVVCTRLEPEADEFVLARLEGTTEEDSGWFAGCLDDGHDHNTPEALGRTLLYNLALRNPETIPYLALPPEILVVVHKDQRPEILREGKELDILDGSFLELKFTQNRN